MIFYILQTWIEKGELEMKFEDCSIALFRLMEFESLLKERCVIDGW